MLSGISFGHADRIGLTLSNKKRNSIGMKKGIFYQLTSRAPINCSKSSLEMRAW